MEQRSYTDSANLANNPKGNEVETLKGFVKALMDTGLKGDKKLKDAVKDAKVSAELKEAAEAFAEAKKPLILTSPALFDATNNIALLKGTVLALPFESNAKGVAHMGLVSKGKSYKEMVTEGMKVLYAIGDVPLSERPDCDMLIVQSSHITELAKQADVILPAATYLEAPGTIVDYKGRLRHIPRLIDPMGKSKMHRDVLQDVAKAMGKKLDKVTEKMTKDKFKLSPKASIMPFERKSELNVSPEMILESVSSALLNSSRLLWLKESEKAVTK